MEWSSVLVYPIYVLQCLHAIVDTMSIIRKPQRFWYLKSYDTTMDFPAHWTLLSLSYLSVYYSRNLLWWHSVCIPLGWSGSWSVIQDHSHGSSKEPMNLWPERIHQFLWCTSDLGSLILIQLTPKKCTLYLYWTFCYRKPPDKIVNYLIGWKIISNVNKHYSTYDSLKYCLCSDIVMRLSFFSKILPFATP